MKAAVLSEINKPLLVKDVEPAGLSQGQVLVKILVSGICGAQLQEIAGNKNNAAYVPHLLGHEGAAIVEKVGPGVTTVKVGDKVVVHWRPGEGIEADFPTYILDGKPIRSGKATTFSEYSIVSENRVTAVPADTPNDLCALLGCGLSTALGVIENEAAVQKGESVMIVGAGGVGLNLLSAAKMVSAYPIILVDIHEHKREVCEALGADLFVNCAAASIERELKEKLGSKDIDVIIDTSGNTQSIENTIPLLSGKGRYIMVGQPKPGESIEIKNAIHLFGGNGKMIKATQGGKFVPQRDIPRYLDLYNRGVFKLDGIVTHRVKLDNINDAIELVRAGQAGRVMIDLW